MRFKGALTRRRVVAEVAATLGLKGMPKINAVIAGTPYRGSLMAKGDGTYCLGVLKSIQEAARLGSGDSITVDLGLDTAPGTVELPHSKQAIATSEALSFTNKNEMARSLEAGRRPQTRERRLAQAVEALRKAR
ncbi:MAG TPA: YdeI/OmpD-associated family protein [Candidatus Micrarchaeaceae archaeon]|nr:YdeI/OmpD-associated family protein [Candidatus Micrarchaeaceae archaeon]